MLVLTTVVNALSNTTVLNTTQKAQPQYARYPLVCSSSEVRRPSIHQLNHDFQCDPTPRRDSTHAPTPVKVTVYRKNVVEWRTAAYQCTKMLYTISTQISLFTDVKTKKESHRSLPVSRSECEDMVLKKRCNEGALSGSDGAYTTKNKAAGLAYVWCCKWHDFEVKQCSYITASVYKTFGKSSFESTAGDVSHCNSYSDGYCKLRD